MKPIKKALSVVLTNFFIFFLLLSALVLLPAAIADVWKLVAGYESEEEEPIARAFLPNYKNHAWAETHFRELKKLTTVYYDYIGWRRAEFHGETITIDRDGYRRHDGISGSSFQKSSIWMFGGSTLWGTGVSDSFTIPAYLQQYATMPAFNFGESGHTAHQNLNLLIKAYLMGGRPEHVFFYSGVNDVAKKCRSEISFYSTGQENRIRERLQHGDEKASELLKVFAPSIRILQKLMLPLMSDKSGNRGFYNCSTDREKTRLIAQAMLLDWSMAKKLVEENGGKFHAILQPVSFIGTPNLSQLKEKKRDHLREEFMAVYQEILRQLDEKKFEYADFTGIFDSQELFYIDFCHVSPEGNEKIAQRIFQELIQHR